MATSPNSSGNATSKIRAVILDYGEGLCHLPAAEHIERLAEIFQAALQSFFPMYLKTRADYDRGDMLPSAYWRKFAAQAGVAIDEKTIEELRQIDKDMWSR